MYAGKGSRSTRSRTCCTVASPSSHTASMTAFCSEPSLSIDVRAIPVASRT